MGAYGVTPSDLKSFAMNLRDTGDGHLGYGMVKLGKVFVGFAKLILSPGALVFFVCVAMSLFATRRRALIRFGAIPVLLALWVLFWKSRTSAGGLGAHGYLIGLSLLAPILAGRLNDRSYVRPWLLAVWLPSFALGIVMGWASTNGLLASAIGIVPAALVAAVYLGEWLRESCAGNGLSIAPFSASALVLFSMLYFGSSTFSEGRHRRPARARKSWPLSRSVYVAQ